MKAINVAAIQPRPVSETMAELQSGRDIDHALELLDQAAERSIDIACFSELYPMVGEAQLCEKAKDLGIYIIAGLVEDGPGGKYNTGTLISPEGFIVGRQRKCFPTSLEMDMGIQRGSQSYEVFQTPIGNFGIVICSDFAFFNTGIQQLKAKQVDIIFNPSWWFALGEAYSATVIGRHLEYGVPVVGVDIAKMALKADIEGQEVRFPPAGGYSTVTVPPGVENLAELADWFNTMPGGTNSMKGFVWMLDEDEGILTRPVDVAAVRKFPGYFYTQTPQPGQAEIEY